MTEQQHEDPDDAAAEAAADEALHASDPVRWELNRRDRGAAARRFVAGLAARHAPTEPAAGKVKQRD